MRIKRCKCHNQPYCMKRNIIVEMISALFILLFVYTAINKLLDGASFETTLSKSPFLGNIAGTVAVGLPLTEMFIALLLLAPRSRRIGLYASATLMVLFTLYLSYMIAFTPKLPCSCGGVLKQMTWNQHLIFNLFFTGLAITGIWLSKHPRNGQKQANQPDIIYT